MSSDSPGHHKRFCGTLKPQRPLSPTTSKDAIIFRSCPAVNSIGFSLVSLTMACITADTLLEANNTHGNSKYPLTKVTNHV